MPFRIGDVVSLMGLTREAVRSYEDVGIIKPKRDEQSGYRFYDLTDLGALIRVRRYRAYGFSLREAAMLLNDCGVEEVHSRLLERGDALEAEIRERQRLLDCLRKWSGIVEAIPRKSGVFAIEQSPSIYALELTEGERLSRDPAMRARLRTWVEREPIVFSCGLWEMEEGRCLTEKPRMYLGAEEEDLPALGLDCGEPVQHWPRRTCLHTVIRREEGEGRECDQLAPALAHLKEQGLTPAGNPFIRTILLVHKRGDAQVFRDLWLPLE